MTHSLCLARKRNWIMSVIQCLMQILYRGWNLMQFSLDFQNKGALLISQAQGMVCTTRWSGKSDGNSFSQVPFMTTLSPKCFQFEILCVRGRGNWSILVNSATSDPYYLWIRWNCKCPTEIWQKWPKEQIFFLPYWFTFPRGALVSHLLDLWPRILPLLPFYPSCTLLHTAWSAWT